MNLLIFKMNFYANLTSLCIRQLTLNFKTLRRKILIHQISDPLNIFTENILQNASDTFMFRDRIRPERRGYKFWRTFGWGKE